MKTRTPRVLVVDDETETLDLLKLALERNGFVVLTAASWEAVQYTIERTYRQEKPIDVIVLDLMMPDRSGFDVLRALQVALVPMPPVIMLSAVTGIEQQIQARDLGVEKYLTKPTTPTKLAQAIRELLKR